MIKRLITQADIVKEGETLHAAMEANAADLGHLAGSRDKLKGLLEQVRELLVQQQDAIAVKLDLSRQLQGALRATATLIAMLRKAAQEHYGNRNDKLAAFGIPPFRGRRRVEPAPPVVPPPAVE
jgi:hypothetical protein